MGLDMHAIEVPNNAIIDDFGFNDLDIAINRDFWYWRKNNALHNRMNNLYSSKGGTEEFNGDYVRITSDDLLTLQSDIEQNKLQPTAGFFWGRLEYTEDTKHNDLCFIKSALESIAQGNAIYYSSSW